jgi:chorismate mutase
MNDIKLLDFPALAREFQQAYLQLRSERLALAQKVAERKYLQQRQQLLEQLGGYGEGGSDGLDEAITESLGDFDVAKVQLTEFIVQQCKAEAKAAVVEAWAQKNAISQKLSWLPHQMLAYFGGWKAVRDENGLYSAALTWDANTRLREDYFALGSALLATSARTNFFKDAPKGNQQYKSPINPLVPIILAGFKKYQGIKYSEWNLVGLDMLLDPELAKLVGVTVPDISQSELIALRNTAITDKTGPRQGIPNNPATCTKLNHLGDTAIGHLPKLAKFMVLQTWAAHPSNRNEYMILDPNSWDNIPEPLIARDVFTQPVKPAVAAYTSNFSADLPWSA